MMKLRSKILAGVSVVAVAGAVAAAGLTAASASQAAGAASSGTEHFQLMTTSAANNAPSSIIARGVFTAGGVDHPGNKVDTVVFPDGTFKIAHSKRHRHPALQRQDVPGRHHSERHLPAERWHGGVRGDQRARDLPAEHPDRRRPQLGGQVQQ